MEPDAMEPGAIDPDVRDMMILLGVEEYTATTLVAWQREEQIRAPRPVQPRSREHMYRPWGEHSAVEDSYRIKSLIKSLQTGYGAFTTSLQTVHDEIKTLASSLDTCDLFKILTYDPAGNAPVGIEGDPDWRSSEIAPYKPEYLQIVRSVWDFRHRRIHLAKLRLELRKKLKLGRYRTSR